MYLDVSFSKMCVREEEKEHVEELCPYINTVWKEAKTATDTHFWLAGECLLCKCWCLTIISINFWETRDMQKRWSPDLSRQSVFDISGWLFPNLLQATGCRAAADTVYLCLLNQKFCLLFFLPPSLSTAIVQLCYTSLLNIQHPECLDRLKGCAPFLRVNFPKN